MKKIITVDNCINCPYCYVTESNDWCCWNIENDTCPKDPIIKNIWKISEWCKLKTFEE